MQWTSRDSSSARTHGFAWYAIGKIAARRGCFYARCIRARAATSIRCSGPGTTPRTAITFIWIAVRFTFANEGSVPRAAQRHVGHLVLVILLRVASHQQLDAGEHAVFVEPDLRALGIEADQLQIGIVLAALEPGRDETIPQPLEGRAVVVQHQFAVQRGEQVMSLGNEVRDGAMSLPHGFDEVGVLGGEKPDGSGTLVAVQLRGHGLGMAFFDTR